MGTERAHNPFAEMQRWFDSNSCNQKLIRKEFINK